MIPVTEAGSGVRDIASPTFCANASKCLNSWSIDYHSSVFFLSAKESDFGTRLLQTFVITCCICLPTVDDVSLSCENDMVFSTWDDGSGEDKLVVAVKFGYSLLLPKIPKMKPI